MSKVASVLVAQVSFTANVWFVAPPQTINGSEVYLCMRWSPLEVESRIVQDLQTLEGVVIPIDNWEAKIGHDTTVDHRSGSQIWLRQRTGSVRQFDDQISNQLNAHLKQSKTTEAKHVVGGSSKPKKLAQQPVTSKPAQPKGGRPSKPAAGTAKSDGSAQPPKRVASAKGSAKPEKLKSAVKESNGDKRPADSGESFPIEKVFSWGDDVVESKESKAADASKATNLLADSRMALASDSGKIASNVDAANLSAQKIQSDMAEAFAAAVSGDITQSTF
jgi:hypothetical protein